MPSLAKAEPTRTAMFLKQVDLRAGTPATQAGCSSCRVREACLSAGCLDEVERVQNVVYARRRVRRGEALFNAGTQCASLYAIRSGVFKTSVIDRDGREQVTGFYMAGETLGADGLGTGSYDATAIALEDAEVCAMPLSLVESLACEIPAFQRHLHRVLAREIVANHAIMMLLGSMTAEQRVAAFLTNLSGRFQRLGFSATEFHLRMSREDIGSYLGLKLETVSRAFSRLQADGVLEVQGKHLRIADPVRLGKILKP